MRLVTFAFLRSVDKARPKLKVTIPVITKPGPNRLLLSRPVFGTEKVAEAMGSVGVTDSVGSGVIVGVSVGVFVGETGVLVGVLVGVFVGDLGVMIGVSVGVFVGETGVLVGVFVGVFVGGTGVLVGVFVGVLVGVVVGCCWQPY